MTISRELAIQGQQQPNPMHDLGEYTVTRKDTVYLTIYGTIKRTTDKAMLMALDDERTICDLDISPLAYTRGVWIPLSQCLQLNETDSTSQDTAVISEWIAGVIGIQGGKS